MHFRFAFDTKATPQQVVAAFTDFTERRTDIWAGSLDPEKYEVRELGDTSAVVREGSARPSIWAVERYDWSAPGVIKWSAIESNFCKAGSGVEMTVTPGPDGGSHVEGEWHRDPKGLKGYMLVTLGGTVGRKMIVRGYREALDRYAESG